MLGFRAVDTLEAIDNGKHSDQLFCGPGMCARKGGGPECALS